jgi:hypothetical protein
MFVYLVIRDLDSYDGPEIDVFTDLDLAHDWAATLRDSGREVIEQEQGILDTADIDSMKETLS